MFLFFTFLIFSDQYIKNTYQESLLIKVLYQNLFQLNNIFILNLDLKVSLVFDFSLSKLCVSRETFLALVIYYIVICIF